MKKFLTLIAAVMFVLPAAAQQEPDFSLLEKSKHPRLLVSDKEFKEYVSIVKSGDNKCLSAYHRAVMERADAYLEKPFTFKFQYAKSGRLAGSPGQDCFKCLSVLAYAYRFSRDNEYLYAAEKVLERICDLEHWNHDRYLNCSAFMSSVVIAYDWMYKGLDPKLKKKIVSAVQEKGFKPTENPKVAVWRKMTNNHNQVDNCALVMAAIAMYEHNPEFSQMLIKDALVTNPRCQKEMYSPDGNYPEGPGYWQYGTQNEIIMLSALEHSFGTAFGLDEIEGFDKTADFAQFAVGNLGLCFNYQDCNDDRFGLRLVPEMFYFAAKKGDFSYAYKEMKSLEKGKVPFKKHYYLALFPFYLAQYDGQPVSAPHRNIYYGRGNTPLVIARTGWEKSDLYLGIKGGRANFTHGHMDAGSFVFEADGVRWAVELNHKNYGTDEVGLKKLGASLWNRNQGQVRWRIMSNDNHFHNTLTVNDKEHVFNGVTSLVEVYEDENCLGGKFDMSAAFFDLEKAERTAVIRDRSFLEVTDVLKASGDAPASVRWTLMTSAEPEVCADGIVLRKDGKTMKLSVEGVDVEYRTWPTDPKAYADNPVAFFDEQPKGVSCCGFVFTLPAGKELSMVTTIKRK